jgi:hypothetical protein
MPYRKPEHTRLMMVLTTIDLELAAFATPPIERENNARAVQILFRFEFREDLIIFPVTAPTPGSTKRSNDMG